MEEFISNLKILLGTVGYKTLEAIGGIEFNSFPTIENSEDTIMRLTLKVKEINAKAYLTNEGIVVIASSQASKTVKKSLSSGYKKLRYQLIETGVLENSDNGYIFTKDYLFKSPSQAAAIIVGYAINGRHHWQTQDEQSLKELEELSQKNVL